jgi:hypothetical protein
MAHRRTAIVCRSAFVDAKNFKDVSRGPSRGPGTLLCAPKHPQNRGGAHKKGRLRCHKQPKSREETPKEGSDSGATAYPYLRRSRPAAQLNGGEGRASKGVTERYEGLLRSPLKPTTSALGVGRHWPAQTSASTLDHDATVSASPPRTPTRDDVRFWGKIGSHGQTVKMKRMTPKRTSMLKRQICATVSRASARAL